jgi:thiol-disulfide isomerase/thioredoxin
MKRRDALRGLSWPALAGTGLRGAGMASSGLFGASLAGAGLAGVLTQTRAQAAPEPSSPAPGDAVRWPEVPLLDGSRFGPAQAQGQGVVVVFWATTCPFCRRHNQHVELLQQKVRSAGLPLRVLTAARDRDESTVRRYMQAQGYSFGVTMAWRELAAALSRRNVMPLTVTVDRRGQLRQVIPGEMFEDDVLELQGLAT